MAERDALGYDGTVIGDRYEVERHLGRGSYANVYIVKDKQERLIRKAMKIIDIGHEVGNVDGDEQTFVTEHELMKGLHHPNIFSLCDSFIIKDNFYLITEYCQGGDLDRYLGRCKDQNQKLEENQVTKWIKQILQAVEYIHERDIIHRDIKPRNILLQDGAVKLGDFGVARNVGSAGLANTIVGTICYLSPEVLKHDGYNTKFDIWSVGCVLYEMVTFKRAFDGSNLMTALFRIVEGKIPEWPRGYSPHLQDVFTRALTMEHTERPSALELLQILDDPDGRTLDRDIEGLIIGDTRSESTESEERSITEETCREREYFQPLECGKDTDESEMSRVPLGRDDEEHDHEMVSDSIDSLPVRPPRKHRGLPVERHLTPSVTVKQPDSEDVTLIANCVVKQKPDDPGLIYVDCCLKTKLPQLVEELRHQGYTKGPMPSKDVHLKHYEEIIVTSKGGIKLNLDHEGREEFVFVFDSRSDRNGQEGWICSKDHSGAASMGFVVFSVKRYNAEDGSFHMETLCSLPVSISGTLCEPPIVQQNTQSVVTHAGPSLSATDGGHPEEFWNPVVAITRALGDNWMGLARELHYSTVNIGHFQQQSDNGSTDAIVTMLMDWFRRTREMSDKIGQLTEALLNTGHKDVANEIIQREANARSEKNFQLAVETMVEDAHLLNDWQVFLRTLGLSDADILTIEFNQKIPNLKNLVRQGVSLWRKKEGMEAASVSKLVECLENINNKRLAEKISEYCGC